MRDPTPPQIAAAHPSTPTSKHTRTRQPRPLLLPPTPPVRSRRAATIVRWFGLGEAMEQRTTDARETQPAQVAFALAPGTITLITGPSGAGKSSLLSHLQRSADAPGARHTIKWIDLASVKLPNTPIVDCFSGNDVDVDDDEEEEEEDNQNRTANEATALHARGRRGVPETPGVLAPSVALRAHPTVQAPPAFASPAFTDCAGREDDDVLRETLLALARVGLAEAWTYLRTPAELSDGQRWRLRLAVALERARREMSNHSTARVVLVADEFAALLDRVTGCVVARSLRRAVAPGSRVAAVVATAHDDDDVTRALSPDVLVRCDFGRVTVRKTPTIHSGSNPGGPMRKIIVTSLTTLALLATAPAHVAHADEPHTRSTFVAPRGGNDRLLLEPPSPFEPERSLFRFDPRPPRREPAPLYPSVERELDRGTGRIESDVEFDTGRWQRAQDERLGIVRPERELERFEEERDRALRIETQQRRAGQADRAQRQLESESQRLAAERERFYRSAGIDATGAAHDTRQLKNLERAYQRDVKQLRRDRAAELKRLEQRDDLRGDALRAARAQIDERYRAAQTQRRERHATDRARVLGSE